MSGRYLTDAGDILTTDAGEALTFEETTPAPPPILLGQACLVLPFLLCVGWMFAEMVR